MSENASTPTDTLFRINPPQVAFEAYCRKERIRLEKTDPNFNPAIFQEAQTLVLERLVSSQTKETGL